MRHAASFWLPVAGSTLLLLAACSSGTPQPASKGPTLPANAPSAVRDAFQNGTPVAPDLVAADNGLGFALFNQVRTPGANTFVSPPSLALALDMTYNGAAGATQQGMAQALALGTLDAGQLNLDNAALLASLLTADADVTLQIADSIWSRSDILPAFLATNQTYYGAYLGTMDGAPATVNTWVDQATQGHIPTLLDPTADLSKVDALLVNAIYFKGAWTTPFPAGATVSAPFTRLDGTQVSCSMMNVTTQAGYATTPQATALRLPYGNGRFAMVCLLPAGATTLDALAASLTPAAWTALVQNLSSTPLDLALPKFKAAWRAELRDALTALGMGVAFDPNQADFSLLSTVPEYLASVLQATTVEVDETGSTATGATVVIVAPTAVETTTQVTLDHPFLYAIQDTKTGEILFLGQMVDPTAG